MALPTELEIRGMLEGYGIDDTVVSDAWIASQRDGYVIPHIQNILGYTLDAENTVTEYYSGNGTDTLFLNKKGISEITNIETVTGYDVTSAISLSSVVLLSGKGMIKARAGVPEYTDARSFPKGRNNIKITYKIGGDITAELSFVVKAFSAIMILDNIEGRTGGGSLSVQGFSRDFGNMGRYSNIRKRLNGQAVSILKKYKSSVVGS